MNDTIKVGMKWEDAKGFQWEVFENLFFGKWRVRRADGSRVGEMSGKEIHAELENEWKRKLEAAR
jgi:hypothetical protein